MICEEVPCDPNWFYLATVHCTFWTNKAMTIWYNEHNFKGCAYNLEAQMWLMFKDKNIYEKLKSKVKNLSGSWTLSDNFVDYWKVKPYRTK